MGWCLDKLSESKANTQGNHHNPVSGNHQPQLRTAVKNFMDNFVDTRSHGMDELELNSLKDYSLKAL